MGNCNTRTRNGRHNQSLINHNRADSRMAPALPNVENNINKKLFDSSEYWYCHSHNGYYIYRVRFDDDNKQLTCPICSSSTIEEISHNDPTFYNQVLTLENNLDNDPMIEVIGSNKRTFDSLVEHKLIDNQYIDNQYSECPICFEDFIIDKSNVVKLSCNHTYCAKCIKSWLIRSTTCPVCRFNIDKSKNENKI